MGECPGHLSACFQIGNRKGMPVHVTCPMYRGTARTVFAAPHGANEFKTRGS